MLINPQIESGNVEERWEAIKRLSSHFHYHKDLRLCLSLSVLTPGPLAWQKVVQRVRKAEEIETKVLTIFCFGFRTVETRLEVWLLGDGDKFFRLFLWLKVALLQTAWDLDKRFQVKVLINLLKNSHKL